MKTFRELLIKYGFYIEGKYDDPNKIADYRYEEFDGRDVILDGVYSLDDLRALVRTLEELNVK